MMDNLLVTIEADKWAEAAIRWLEAAEARRGSKRTRNEYEANMRLFMASVSKHPAQITGSDCQRWASEMHQAGLANATIKARLAAVSSFYRFAQRYEVTPGQYLHSFNPASAVQRPHVNPYEHAQGLTPEQAKVLLKACDRATVKGLRDYALLAFYLYTGRRRSEIARLCWQDLRAGSEAGKLEYHYTGKGHKSAWREIPPPVWTALQNYLKAAGRLETMRGDSPLFVATQHQSAEERPIAPITINQIVDRASKLAGLEHLKVHSLRHTAAKLRRRSGADLEEVSQFLDHSSIATTQIYINSLEAVKDVSWQGVEALIGG